MVDQSEVPANTESVACPLCGGESGLLVGSRGRFGMPVRNLCCETCSMIYVSPRPTANAMARYYRSAYREQYRVVGRLRADQTRIAPGGDEATQTVRQGFENQALVVRRIAKTAPGARVLEIGCQCGETLRLLDAELGIEAHGIEPSERQAEVANQAGVRCFAGTLEQYDPGSLLFDQIQMFHVLEHLHEPLAALLSIRSWLVRGGALVVEVPNAYSPYGLLEENFFQNVHLTTWSPVTLPALLRRAGFDIGLVVDSGTLLVLARPAEHASLPAPFEPGLLTHPEQGARWVSDRLATYATLERIRHLVRERGLTPHVLNVLLRTVAAPAFPEHLMEICAEVVERLVASGPISVARLVLERVASAQESSEVRAELLAYAQRLVPTSSTV